MGRIYRTDSRGRSPAPFVGPPNQAMVQGIVEDVVQGVGVLLLRVDQLRPEAAAEDVVLASVALVEGAGVGAVQGPHSVREVWGGRLDDQVVVVSEQTADVGVPAVAAFDPSEDVEEDDAIVVVQHDGQLIVPPSSEVIVSAGRKVSAWAAHLFDGSARPRGEPALAVVRHPSDPDRSRARHGTGHVGPCGPRTGLNGTCWFGSCPGLVQWF
jgi:hypothetical protein